MDKKITIPAVSVLVLVSLVCFSDPNFFAVSNDQSILIGGAILLVAVAIAFFPKARIATKEPEKPPKDEKEKKEAEKQKAIDRLSDEIDLATSQITKAERSQSVVKCMTIALGLVSLRGFGL